MVCKIHRQTFISVPTSRREEKYPKIFQNVRHTIRRLYLRPAEGGGGMYVDKFFVSVGQEVVDPDTTMILQLIYRVVNIKYCISK